MLTRMIDGKQVVIPDDEEAQIRATWALSDAEQPTLAIKAQIEALEATQTPRRIREALRGTDNGWLDNVDAQIAALRAQLA
jgi:hypothetical protein